VSGLSNLVPPPQKQVATSLFSSCCSWWYTVVQAELESDLLSEVDAIRLGCTNDNILL
jgi:hypothetical protein